MGATLVSLPPLTQAGPIFSWVWRGCACILEGPWSPPCVEGAAVSQSRVSQSPFHHTPQSQNPPLPWPGGHRAQGNRGLGDYGVGCAPGRVAQGSWRLGSRVCHQWPPLPCHCECMVLKPNAPPTPGRYWEVPKRSDLTPPGPGSPAHCLLGLRCLSVLCFV